MGVVQIDAVEHEAVAYHGSIPAGMPVRVVGTRGTRLVVEVDVALLQSRDAEHRSQ